MNYLFVINDSPYGNERPYNALRLALKLVKRDGVQVRVFLMGDGVQCAAVRQSTPDGYYNIERMLKSVISKGGQVKACGTCSEARGIKGLTLIEGVEISTMSQLTLWTVESDKVITF